MKKMSAIAAVLVFLALASWSASAQDRDPFFSAGPRSSSAPPPAADGSWGRDPFNRPFEGPEQAASPPGARGKALTGIIFSKEVRLAIIGGEAFTEGSLIGNQKLVEIRAGAVVFVDGSGNREEVSLEDFSMRK